jgi:hypothetical protein
MLGVTAIAAVAVPGMGQGAGASVTPDVRPVVAVPAFTPVAGAQSTLIRDDDAITFALHTSELTPGVSATLLLVVFNNPKGCTHGVEGCIAGRVTWFRGVPPSRPSLR